jgi:hypothetical protein
LPGIMLVAQIQCATQQALLLPLSALCPMLPSETPSHSIHMHPSTAARSSHAILL